MRFYQKVIHFTNVVILSYKISIYYIINILVVEAVYQLQK